MSAEYPKTMARGDKERPVLDAVEEAEKAAEGWVVVHRKSDYDTKSTFGDSGDDTHTKRKKS